MLTYLLDTSAAVEIYMPDGSGDRFAKRVLNHIIEQKALFREAILFIPNFCIAEVFNTFARKHYSPKDSKDKLSDVEYGRCVAEFRDDIHWGKTLYPYDLNRYHVVATDKIVIAEHLLPRRDKHDHLNTFDILIIAMACELAHIGRREDTYLVTGDQRLSAVCDELKNIHLPPPTEGPLGELDKDRWKPPTCLNLKQLKRDVLPSASRQGQFQY